MSDFHSQYQKMSGCIKISRYLLIYWFWDNIDAYFHKTDREWVIVLDPTQKLTMEDDENVKINDSQCGCGGSNCF